MDQLDTCQERDMTAHQADVLLGKLGFLLRGTYGSVGRGATQPIYVRKLCRSGESGWNEAIDHAFNFLRHLLRNLLSCIIRLDEDPLPVVLVYTDAGKSTRRAGLDIVISDQGHRTVSPALCPAALQQTFHRGSFIINRLDLMAVVC